MTLTEYARTRRKRKHHASATLDGMSTISVVGSGAVGRFVAATLAQNGFATDAENIGGDFSRALERANLDR